MPHTLQITRPPGDWFIVLKGALLSLFVGVLLFCIVPTLAIRLLLLAGIGIH